MKPATFGLLMAGLLAASDWKPVRTWPPVPDSVQWGKPSAVLALADGAVMIFQRGSPALLRFDAEGKMIAAFSTGFFQNAHGLKMAPDGNIWVTDYTRHVIVKFSPDGKQLLMLGQPDRMGSDREHFGGVADLAFLPNGEFYVADGYKNSRVVKFDRNGKYLKEWGRPGAGPGEFHLPHCIAIDKSGKVYVGDRENKRIQIFTADGKYLNEWHTGSPYGITFASDGTLWMADGVNNRVVRIDKAGRVIDSFDLPVDKPDGSGGHMLSVAGDGSIYVAETGRFMVRKYVRGK